MTLDQALTSRDAMSLLISLAKRTFLKMPKCWEFRGISRASFKTQIILSIIIVVLKLGEFITDPLVNYSCHLLINCSAEAHVFH